MDKYQIEPVRGKDQIPFQCRRCGQCCRNIKEQIMLESLDAYRLGNYLLKQGIRLTGLDDVFNQYTQPAPLTSEGYPIFLLLTAGADNACVFLKDGTCSIYPARPRTCRLYPFTVGPGERGKDFEYYLCRDKAHHMAGGRVTVKNWMYDNFRQEDREFTKKEFQYAAEIGPLLRQIDSRHQEHRTFLLLFFRYFNYNLQEPFFPQYDNNHIQLLEALKRLV